MEWISKGIDGRMKSKNLMIMWANDTPRRLWDAESLKAVCMHNMPQ